MIGKLVQHSAQLIVVLDCSRYLPTRGITWAGNIPRPQGVAVQSELTNVVASAGLTHACHGAKVYHALAGFLQLALEGL